LVIDAVDTYNERWEEAFRETQTQQQLQLQPQQGQPMNEIVGGAAGGGGTGENPNNIGNRRMMFMSEKERKEELIMKQRAELAIKKGTAELDPEIEKFIGMEILEALEAELTKLLLFNDDGSNTLDSNIRTNLPISRKSIQDNILVNNAHNVSMDIYETQYGMGHNNGDNNSPNKSTNTTPGKNNSIFIKNVSEVEIEDLFNFENLENENNLLNDSTDTIATNENEGDNASGNNEFAAELLYIMKTAISLS
jgi:hypothetical protein